MAKGVDYWRKLLQAGVPVPGGDENGAKEVRQENAARAMQRAAKRTSGNTFGGGSLVTDTPPAGLVNKIGQARRRNQKAGGKNG